MMVKALFFGSAESLDFTARKMSSMVRLKSMALLHSRENGYGIGWFRWRTDGGGSAVVGVAKAF